MSDKQDLSTAGSLSDEARIAFFTPTAALILCYVDPVEIEKFYRVSKGYELEMESKHVEIPALKPTSYAAIFNRSLPKHLLFMGAFEEVPRDATVESLTGEHIKA